MMISLTEQAHRVCNARKGDIVIDATAGNGHDTLFLARSVGPFGTVYAFDIQADALQITAERLAEAEITNVKLIHDDHARLTSWVEPHHHGRISTVMFNLGYRPGGDKSLITRSESTLAAITAGIQLLRVGGTMTILAYPGHPGGREEMAVVEQIVSEVTPRLLARWYTGAAGTKAAPRLLVLTKVDPPEFLSSTGTG